MSQQLINFLGSGKASFQRENVGQVADGRRFPFPATVKPEVILPAYVPKYLNNKSGIIYANHVTDGLKYYDDFSKDIAVAANWKTRNATAPSSDSVDNCSLAMMDSGRAIWCTLTGKVYVSNTTGTTYTLAFTFVSGYADAKYGTYVDKDVAIISAYGTKNSANSPREVYATFDGGANWRLIFTGENRVEYHVHSTGWNPETKTVFIGIGDIGGRQVVYSTDAFWNTTPTWHYLWKDDNGNPKYGVGRQPTDIRYSSEGMLFSSDSAPDGIDLIPRNPRRLQTAITSDDYIIGYYRMNDDTTTLRNLFRRSWSNMDHAEGYDHPIYAFCTGDTGSGSATDQAGLARVIISIDAINFYEIHALTDQLYGYHWVLGASHLEGAEYLYVVSFGYSAFHVHKFKMPRFINPNKDEVNAVVTGQRGYQIKPDIKLPLTVAAGGFPVLAVINDCEKKGYRKIKVAYKWEASISNQIYFQQCTSGGVSIINELSGAATNQAGIKETEIKTSQIRVVANNGDAAPKILTDLEITVWPN